MAFSFIPSNFLLLNYLKNIDCKNWENNILPGKKSFYVISSLVSSSFARILTYRGALRSANYINRCYYPAYCVILVRASRFDRMLNRNAPHFRDGKKSIVQWGARSNCRLVILEFAWTGNCKLSVSVNELFGLIPTRNASPSAVMQTLAHLATRYETFHQWRDDGLLFYKVWKIIAFENKISCAYSDVFPDVLRRAARESLLNP